MVMNSATGASKNSKFLLNCASRADRIVAVDAERAVELHAMLLAAVLIGAEHRVRIDLDIRSWRGAGCRGEALLHDRLEFGERLAGQRIDVPGLQIAAGRRARGARNQILDDGRIDRLVEKVRGRRCGNRPLQRHPWRCAFC